jgi:predicted aspartyl protease
MIRHRTVLLWAAGVLCATGCERLAVQSPDASLSSESVPVAVEPSASPSSNPTTPATASRDTFAEAINTASRAFQLGQSARSQDDWSLVASRWQQAVDLLVAVPNSSPNYTTAQTKLAEYRRNLSYAEQQASKPIDRSSGVIVVTPNRVSQPSNSAPIDSTTARSQPSAPARSSSTAALSAESVVVTPIIARAGGTPVINVLFNGSAVFPMIVDTGASGTLITAEMAAALNVQAAGEAKVDTASQRNITLTLGYVQSIQVEDAVTENVLVAIAGPELDIGLLGHDFFGNYDVTVRANVVEFRER